MMELKVWVDGIQRVVCGATFDTTCQDVVIALAHAMGRTGRFTLIEKWRDNDRPLTPAECPLQVLHKWGEYAAEVRFVLCQAETNHHKQSSRDKLVKKGSDIPGYSPNFAVSPRVQGIVGEGNVKRSSTFSGAHNQAGDVSSWLNSSAPTSKLRKTHLGPVPNGDVRQPASSAFTPHPSAQPRHQAGLGGGAVERGLQPSSDHHASTQRDPHHPIPPPRRRASPTLPQQNKDNLRNSASSSVPSSLSSSSDHHYHQQQQHQQANSSRGGGVSSQPQPPQHSPRSHPPPSHPPSSHPTLSHPPPLQQSGSHPQPFPHGIQSHPEGQGPSHPEGQGPSHPGGQGPSHPQPQPRHPPHHPQSHPHPQPHSRSAQSQGQVQGPNQRTLSQPHSQPQSLPHSQPHSQPYAKAPSPQPPPLPSSPPPTQPSPSPRHGPRDSLVAEEALLDPRYGPRDSLVAEEATLDSPSNLSRQASLEIEEYDLDRNFPDTHRDANRNGRPSVSLEYRLEDGVGSGSVGQGRGHGQGQVQMEGEHAKLLRLVNMQQERLKTQESQIGLVNTEITTLEEKEKEYENSLQAIMEELLLCENRGRDLEPQLNDLEKVEWENVLDGEKKCEVDITLQIVTYKAKVLEKEHELEDVKKKEGKLLEELKAEEKNISQERERLKEEGIRAREKEDKTRGHITQMQSEFVQLQQRAAECESSLSEVDGELKSAEKDLETRTQVLDDLEESLKDENLKDFAANPPPKEADPTAKVKDSGEAIIKILEGRLSPRLNPSVSDKASDNPSTPPFIAALASKNQSGVWV